MLGRGGRPSGSHGTPTGVFRHHAVLQPSTATRASGATNVTAGPDPDRRPRRSGLQQWGGGGETERDLSEVIRAQCCDSTDCSRSTAWLKEAICSGGKGDKWKHWEASRSALIAFCCCYQCTDGSSLTSSQRRSCVSWRSHYDSESDFIAITLPD